MAVCERHEARPRAAERSIFIMALITVIIATIILTESPDRELYFNVGFWGVSEASNDQAEEKWSHIM